ncbi:MAG: tRNA-binding protein [Bacteroidetes bacterium]|jgi:tRNA-binding protein|nr:tRNA-binding protein [Bacteroidota bacterium]|tara:strand:- start:146 stop:487 length:342 start_codon:yes stop_codon:yes gene_type:complete
MKPLLDWETFESVQMEVGVIVRVLPFPEARKPALIVHVDFGGERGILKTSAQITERYKPEDLLGQHVVGVVNFPPKQIGPFRSEFLLLGALDSQNGTTLVTIDASVSPGARIA